jgi:hypothetical protein
LQGRIGETRHSEASDEREHAHDHRAIPAQAAVELSVREFGAH